MQNNYSIEPLISAMNQKNFEIFDNAKVKGNALLINQCDIETYEEEYNDGLRRIFSTRERGLSKSRNLAIKNAKGDICLFVDDDEVLEDGYEKIISDAYDKFTGADILCFKLKGGRKNYSDKTYRIGFLKSLKICSCQITFKKKSITDKNILFDENFGSGTIMGSGEENVFLFDCLKKKLRIYYIPICIATVAQQNSGWFKGFDKEYFRKRGAIIRRLMGIVAGTIYVVYFAISKRSMYRRETRFTDAILEMMKGLYRGI